MNSVASTTDHIPDGGHTPRLLELVEQNPIAALLRLYECISLDQLRDRMDHWYGLACDSISRQGAGTDSEWLDIYYEQLQRLAEALHITLLHSLQMAGMPGEAEPDYCWLLHEEVQEPQGVLAEFRSYYDRPRAVCLTWYWLEAVITEEGLTGKPWPDLFPDFERIMVMVAAVYLPA